MAIICLSDFSSVYLWKIIRVDEHNQAVLNLNDFNKALIECANFVFIGLRTFLWFNEQ